MKIEGTIEREKEWTGERRSVPLFLQPRALFDFTGYRDGCGASRLRESMRRD